MEADGARWLDNAIARQDDAERQALLEAHCERVLRVTWKQAVMRPGETITRIEDAGVPRDAAPGVCQARPDKAARPARQREPVRPGANLA